MIGAAINEATGCGTSDTDGVGVTGATVLSALVRAAATTRPAFGAGAKALAGKCVKRARLAAFDEDADTWRVAAAEVDTSVGFFVDVFDLVERLLVLVVSGEDCAEITTRPPTSAVDVDPEVVPPPGVAPEPALASTVPLDGDDKPAPVDCSAPPVGLPPVPCEGGVPPSVEVAFESVGAAQATAGVAATATPTPNATANAPTRPTYFA